VINRRTRLCVAFCSLLALASIASAASPYVILPSGKRVTGSRVTADGDGQILLTIDQGVLTFQPGTRVVMDEPPAIARALQMMQGGDNRSAVGILKKTVEEYRFLDWDRKALRLLGRAHLNLREYGEAAAVYETLLALDPEAKSEADVMTRYLNALAETGDDTKLMPLLAQTIADGPRPAAALAQMIRGGRFLATGKTKLALMDFMRTAELFGEVEEFRKESVLKTAECLDRLGDTRAEAYRKRVK
jgi:tetratricopeptide (TPR) repeat protein